MKPSKRTRTFRQDLIDNDVILRVENLKQFFTSGRGKNKFRNKAVHDISFDVKKGEVFGLVGESGCGKTTTGRSIIRLYDVTSGSVYFKGHRINAGTRWNEKEIKWKTIRTNREIKRLNRELKAKEKALKSELEQKIENESLSFLEEVRPELAASKKELTTLLLARQEAKSKVKEASHAHKSELAEISKRRKDEIRERSDDSQENNDEIVANINKNYDEQVANAVNIHNAFLGQIKSDEKERSVRINELKVLISENEKALDPELKKAVDEKVNLLRAEETVKLNEVLAKEKAETDAKIKELKEVLAQIVKEQKEIIAQIKYDLKHLDKDVMNKMQMIFQDPIDSLNPRMTVADIIQEGLLIQGQKNKKENLEKVFEALEKVGLISDYASRYPHEFSGGQRQRIGIARALVMNPEFIIADEPISALDVSIRAQIINLLNDLRDELGLTILFIAHDLSVVKYFCDRIAVMYYGEIVELTTSEELFKHPLHPYTKSLLSAIPKPDPLSEKKRQRLLYNPFTDHDYRIEKPTLQEILPGHFVLANSKEMEKYREEIKELDIKARKKEAN